jgi:uncharacterized cofD-like protein
LLDSAPVRIVTLGGGTGQAQVLQGLAARGADVTAVVGVTDNGGHSGELRKQLGIPAVGDLRGCIAALAHPKNGLGRALNQRFTSGDLKGASLGNLILAGLVASEGSLTGAAERLTQLAQARGRVLPVSEGRSQISARLMNGHTIRGEWDIIRRRPRARIAALFHDPPISATRDALGAIRRADLVVLGPGSLRTAIVSVLLVKGVSETLKRKRVAFVLNILTQAGQTDGFTAADHVEEISRYLGKVPEVVIANTRRVPHWALQGAEFVDPVGLDHEGDDLLEPLKRSDLVRRARPSNFVSGPHLVRHDPAKVARVILRIAIGGRQTANGKR